MSIPFPPNSPIDAHEFYGMKGGRSDQEFSRKKVMTTYTIDGRKMQDGVLLKPYESEQLWKELFTRQLLHRFYVNATKEKLSM
jgi:hypothetical protein